MASSVCITGCFKNLCDSNAAINGFALIKIVTPSNFEGMIYDNVEGVYYPCDQTWRTDLDPVTGCFTTCPLPCNSNLNIYDTNGNPSSYYEMAIFVNGKQCGLEKFVLDCNAVNYPDPPNCVNIADLTWVSPGTTPSNYHCELVKACETPWVGVGSSCIEVTPGDNPAGLVGNGHSPTFEVVISDAPGNTIVCASDGLYAANKQTFVTVLDTACIDLSISGSGEQVDPYSISAIPNISGLGDNLLECTVDGLYASPTKVEAIGIDCLELSATGTGTEADPIIVSGGLLIDPNSQNLISCSPEGLLVNPSFMTSEDTTCISTEVTGSGLQADPFVVKSTINVSLDSGNLLSCAPDGLLVTCEQVQDCVGSGMTNGLYYDDTTNTYNVRISGDAGNSIEFGSDIGLFVPAPNGSETRITAGNSGSCFTQTVSGTGTVADPYVVNGFVTVDPSFDNALTCGPDGLYAPRTSFEVVGSACFDISLTGAGTVPNPYVLSGAPIVSASPTNALVCTSSGLYVPTPDGSETRLEVFDSNCINLSLAGTGTEVDPYGLNADLIVSTNADNLLNCTPGGLLITCEQVQDCVGQSATQGLVYDDVANTLSVKISGDPRNSVTWGSDSGLYAELPDGSETKFNTIDTSCLNLDILGSGTVVDPYRLSGSPIVSSASDNAISCTPSGLYAKQYNLQSVDSSCIYLDINGDGSLASPWVISADLHVSPNPDNLISCTPAGVELNCEDVQDCVGSGFATGLRYDDATNTYHARISNDSNNDLSFGSDGGLFTKSYDGSETKLQVQDGSCFDFSLTGTGTLANPYILTGSPIIKLPDPDFPDCACDNWLVCTPEGLYVNAPQLEVVSSDCITLSVSGDATCTNPWVVSADVVIDPDDDNILECTASGLRVLPPVVDGSETKIQVVSGNCVDLGISGSGTTVSPYIISSDIEISSNDNNMVRCLSNGLYAEKTFLAVADSSCIDLSLSGAGTFASPYVTSANIVVSTLADNAITCTPDGLYVPITSVTGATTSCVNISVNGSGTQLDPYSVSSSLIIDSASNNLVSCGPNGLKVVCEDIQDCVGAGFTNGLVYDDVAGTYSVRVSGDAGNSVVFGSDTGLYVPVATGAETKLDVISTNCVTVTKVGTGTTANPYIVSAELNLDIRPDNIAQCTADGLFVPASLLELDIVDSNCIDLSLTGNGTLANPYVLSSQLIVSTVAQNLIACTPNGLELTKESVQDAIGDSLGSGLMYDDVNNLFTANVSGDSNNCLSYGSDFGLYVPCPDGSETKVQAVSTSCIDTTVSGFGTLANPYVVASDIVIDPNPANLITCGPNGLFVQGTWSCEEIQDCVGNAFGSGLEYDDAANAYRARLSNDVGNVLAFGSDTGLYVPSSELIQFSTFSTNCITLEITGIGTQANPFVVEANPRIKVAGVSEAENLLECTADGFYVPAQQLIATDSSCVTLDVTGDGSLADPWNLVSNLDMSSASNNIASCTPDGLFVPAPDGTETKIQVGDTSCIDLSIIGAGSTVNPYVLTADIEISVDANNSISCRSNGLYVEKTFIGGEDTSCAETNISGAGTAASPYLLSTAPILSLDVNNLLECTPQGLFAPATQIDVLNTSCIELNISGAGTDASPYTLSSNLVISNALDNLISCTPSGLEITCEEVQDCVGAGFTAGLMYDDTTHTFKAHFSGDTKNIISLGSDGGLFVPSVHVEGVSSSCISVDISGCGTPAEPIIVDVDAIISPDECNTLSCTSEGLLARKVIGFEIGQQCSLDSASSWPYVWRAYESGAVEFKVATLPLFNGGLVDADTNFEIVDKNGNTVYAGSIPQGSEYILLNIPGVAVAPGDAFGVIAVAPFAPTPATGITIQAEFHCGA